jgi:hypothetical protein
MKRSLTDIYALGIFFLLFLATLFYFLVSGLSFTLIVLNYSDRIPDVFGVMGVFMWVISTYAFIWVNRT